MLLIFEIFRSPRSAWGNSIPTGVQQELLLGFLNLASRKAANVFHSKNIADDYIVSGWHLIQVHMC